MSAPREGAAAHAGRRSPAFLGTDGSWGQEPAPGDTNTAPLQLTQWACKDVSAHGEPSALRAPGARGCHVHHRCSALSSGQGSGQGRRLRLTADSRGEGGTGEAPSNVRLSGLFSLGKRRLRGDLMAACQ